jgi:hypothetical protein
MLKNNKLAAVLGLALAASGCLRKETTHTVYLAADGGVRWVAEESGVYSDEADPGARMAEEHAFIGPALINAGRMAQAFQAIGADGLVRTTVIRDERPFHVVTDAPFAHVDRLFQKLFKDAGLPATATLTRDGDRRTLRVRFDFSKEIVERETPTMALLEDLDRLKFVIADGQFIGGGGFDVPDRMTAKISREWMEALEKAIEARSTIEFSLTWHL